MSDRCEAELADITRREYPRLVGMLALYTGDRQVAEDLAQEALVRLHQRWARAPELERVEAWLSRVAMNLANSWWRRRYAEHRANRRALVERTPATLEPETVLAVRAAVAELPRRQRAAVILRFYGGCSVAETAQAMRCREGTVKSLTSHAVTRLRASLQFSDDEVLIP
ncbi:MAG: hypothetical protein QOG87_3127 [Actinomycetota bacterium]